MAMRGALRTLFTAQCRFQSSRVTITFAAPDGTSYQVEGRPPSRLHMVAKDSGVPIECSCNGQAACSTCHVILPDSLFKALPAPEEHETDLLDIVPDQRPTSRLMCQMNVTPELHGQTLTLPEEVRDFY
eukprot:Sspe_Gene.31808::Locus_15651_Transcript_1_1_Confidence_1.000_Length_699::g.31808::m.31808/K22071/FDX2; ferredoxin-2, mitochondrial